MTFRKGFTFRGVGAALRANLDLTMCGRFSLSLSPEAIREYFQLAGSPALRPRYNIAPTQPVAAVRRPIAGQPRELVLLRWGLVPSWAKELAIGNRLINARGETAAEKPSFRGAMRARRCLIAADGYFEWRQEADGKQPFHFRLPGGAPMALAGLWERWESPEHGPVETCTIITTEANSAVAPFHHRMPVILHPADFDLWLEPEQRRAEAVTPLLRPFNGKGPEAHPVTRMMNKASFDDPSCVTPLE